MEQAPHGRQEDMDVQVYSDHDTEVEPAQEHRAMKKKKKPSQGWREKPGL